MEMGVERAGRLGRERSGRRGRRGTQPILSCNSMDGSTRVEAEVAEEEEEAMGEESDEESFDQSAVAETDEKVMSVDRAQSKGEGGRLK